MQNEINSIHKSIVTHSGKEDLITTFQSNERCIHHEKEITEKPASHPIPNKHERCILVQIDA